MCVKSGTLVVLNAAFTPVLPVGIFFFLINVFAYFWLHWGSWLLSPLFV